MAQDEESLIAADEEAILPCEASRRLFSLGLLIGQARISGSISANVITMAIVGKSKPLRRKAFAAFYCWRSIDIRGEISHISLIKELISVSAKHVGWCAW